MAYLTAHCQESPPAQNELPNYDFSIDNLKVFFPNSTREAIEKIAGKGSLIKNNENIVIKRYYVAQLRYKFPVFVQFYQDKSVDFFARLPSYFLHDLFHQALINRYGEQNRYIRIENSALLYMAEYREQSNSLQWDVYYNLFSAISINRKKRY